MVCWLAQMSVQRVCMGSHPILRQKAQPVETFSQSLRRLASDLLDTMYANQGVGIAAPQVGYSLQIFIANPSQERGEELIVINPVLEKAIGRTSITEGCLSIPGIWKPIKRAKHICMRGQDIRGKSFVIDAEGLLAVVLQHEFDHLQGRLFIDRLSWLQRRALASAPSRLE